jgi:hypothetical protein
MFPTYQSKKIEEIWKVLSPYCLIFEVVMEEENQTYLSLNQILF